MLTPHSHLRPNEGEVAAKLMDGEAILIHISTGMYHSMDGVGGLIWECIEMGLTLAQTATAVTERYEVSTEQATEDVLRISGELLNEKLVFESDEAGPAPASFAGASKLPYESPLLNSYRDMSDLLALDPPMPGLQQIPWDKDAA